MKLQDNTVLITGGATGIGYELAKALLEMGNEVIICGRREDRLNEAKAKLPGLHVKVCDVADREQQKILFEWVTGEFPRVNMLINNAGIQKDIDLTRGIEDLMEGDSEIRINFEAPVFLSGLFIPFLAKQKGAAIINITSGLAFMPMPGVPVYCATKAAFHTYTLLLRHQLSHMGIKVFEIVPPMVDTELNQIGRAKRNPKFRGVKPDEYITSVIQSLERDEFEVYFGQTENAKTISRAEQENRFL